MNTKELKPGTWIEIEYTNGAEALVIYTGRGSFPVTKYNTETGEAWIEAVPTIRYTTQNFVKTSRRMSEIKAIRVYKHQWAA